MVGIRQATKKGYVEIDDDGCFNCGYPSSTTRRGRVIDNGRISPTLTTQEGEIVKMEKDGYEYRIRRLTPKETFRLMSFTDEQFDRAKSVGISDNQLYKMAGNSIVVDVLYYIMSNLYDAMPYLFDNVKVGSYFSGIGAFESALDEVYDENKEMES